MTYGLERSLRQLCEEWIEVGQAAEEATETWTTVPAVGMEGRKKQIP